MPVRKEILSIPKGASPWRQGAANIDLPTAAAAGAKEWLPRVPEWPQALKRPLAWEAEQPDAKKLKQEVAAMQQLSG